MNCCWGELRPDGTYSGCRAECKIAIPQFLQDRALRWEGIDRLCARCGHQIAMHPELIQQASTGADHRLQASSVIASTSKYLSGIGLLLF